jgi:hypothetical protein
VDPTENTAFSSSSVVGVFTDSLPRNSRLFVRLLHRSGCTCLFRDICLETGQYTTIIYIKYYIDVNISMEHQFAAFSSIHIF